jgi:triosephosphate isomerase
MKDSELKMRQPLVIGNWKMNGSRRSIKTLIEEILKGLRGKEKAEIGVCPPFVYLQLVRSLLRNTPIVWGAQDVSHKESGAFTGEVAISMIADFRCKYVLVGHSERRHIYGETDGIVAKKFAQVQSANITPILCIGELLEERESNQTENVLKRQLDAVIDLQNIESFKNSVIAYEPVWAIGTGKTATPLQAQEVHQFVRNYLAERNEQVAKNVQILYGGSVKGSNAAELFAMPDIDGGLIGGAALKADEFLAICQAVR